MTWSPLFGCFSLASKSSFCPLTSQLPSLWMSFRTRDMTNILSPLDLHNHCLLFWREPPSWTSCSLATISLTTSYSASPPLSRLSIPGPKADVQNSPCVYYADNQNPFENPSSLTDWEIYGQWILPKANCMQSDVYNVFSRNLLK